MSVLGDISLEQATDNAAVAFARIQALAQQRLEAGGPTVARELVMAMKALELWQAVVEDLSGAPYDPEPAREPARARPVLKLVVGGK